MSAIACVREGHANTDADIQEYMSGNLCRCAAYPDCGGDQTGSRNSARCLMLPFTFERATDLSDASRLGGNTGQDRRMPVRSSWREALRWLT